MVELDHLPQYLPRQLNQPKSSKDHGAAAHWPFYNSDLSKLNVCWLDGRGWAIPLNSYITITVHPTVHKKQCVSLGKREWTLKEIMKLRTEFIWNIPNSKLTET